MAPTTDSPERTVARDNAAAAMPTKAQPVPPSKKPAPKPKKRKAEKAKAATEKDLLQKAAHILKEVLDPKKKKLQPTEGKTWSSKKQAKIDAKRGKEAAQPSSSQQAQALQGEASSTEVQTEGSSGTHATGKARRRARRTGFPERNLAAIFAKAESEPQPAEPEPQPGPTKSKPAPAMRVRRQPTKGPREAPVRSKTRAMPPPGDDEVVTSNLGKVQNVMAHELQLAPVARVVTPVPRLSYQLDRVLFNPGVHFLQDPRSKVFNFDPYLASIMPITEFDFQALKGYITSSRDNTLIGMAKENGKRYTGSTSSMTTFLAHFHYLLSAWRPVNPAHTSRSFEPDSFNFTRINRAPSAAFLHWKDGVYAIDADKEFDTANILSMLGKSMEKLLTLDKEDYERYRLSNPQGVSEEERNAEESYHYTGLGDFLMRSQLDAHDPRVVGTGMFDLKTRAVVTIRMDAQDFHKGLGYEIRNRTGQWESFEREYFDMIRSAFLKYSLQVRMGRMDGIFVAYHNTQRIFGFQYISLPEMDLAIHGTENTSVGDSEFKLSVHLLNKLLDEATAVYPDQSLRIHVETRPTDPPVMYFFAQPVDNDDIEAVQGASRRSVEEFEREITRGQHVGKEVAEEEETAGEEADGIRPVESSEVQLGESEADGVVKPDELDAPGESSTEAGQDLDAGQEVEVDDEGHGNVWEDMLSEVEETLENDELGATFVREAIEDALEESGLLRAKSPEESRQYVDALLGAITDKEPAESAPDSTVAEDLESPSSEAESGAMDGNVAATEENIHDGTATTSSGRGELAAEEAASTEEAPEAAQEGEGENQGRAPSSSTESDTNAGPDEEVPVLSNVSEAEGDEQALSSQQDYEQQRETGSGPAKDQAEPSPTSSLKDLLIRLTEQIRWPPEEKQSLDDTDEQGGEVSPADLLKLRRFKRILSDLTGSSQRRDTQAADQAESDESLGSSSSEPAEDVASEATKSTHKPAKTKKRANEGKPVTGWTVSVRHLISGQHVPRAPDNMTASTPWKLEYSIQQMPTERAQRIYAQLVERRRVRLSPERQDQSWNEMFGGKMKQYVSKGIAFRQQEDALMHGKGVKVAWSYDEAPHPNDAGKDVQ